MSCVPAVVPTLSFSSVLAGAVRKQAKERSRMQTGDRTLAIGSTDGWRVRAWRHGQTVQITLVPSPTTAAMATGRWRIPKMTSRKALGSMTTSVPSSSREYVPNPQWRSYTHRQYTWKLPLVLTAYIQTRNVSMQQYTQFTQKFQQQQKWYAFWNVMLWLWKQPSDAQQRTMMFTYPSLLLTSGTIETEGAVSSALESITIT